MWVTEYENAIPEPIRQVDYREGRPHPRRIYPDGRRSRFEFPEVSYRDIEPVITKLTIAKAEKVNLHEFGKDWGPANEPCI